MYMYMYKVYSCIMGQEEDNFPVFMTGEENKL